MSRTAPGLAEEAYWVPLTPFQCFEPTRDGSGLKKSYVTSSVRHDNVYGTLTP